MNLRVVTFNLHKGYSPLKRSYTLSYIRSLLEATEADVVFLQEIHGLHPEDFKNGKSPLETLADEIWPHFKHGVNSIYPSNFHGNAIMSKYPFTTWLNTDISTNILEKRGLLHGRISVPDRGEVDLFCTHINLFLTGQWFQVRKIIQLMAKQGDGNPRILAGDLNDWSFFCDYQLRKRGGYRRVGLVNTFPSARPMLPLDRIYFKGLDFKDCRTLKAFGSSSDHLPIMANFTL